jgi:hypothetical protein
MRNYRKVVIFLESLDLDKLQKVLKSQGGNFCACDDMTCHTHSWLVEHGVVPGPGDRLHQPSNQPLDSPQQHQQGDWLPSLTLMHMAPVQGPKSMAPSSKWPCYKKAFEWVKTWEWVQLDLGPYLCTELPTSPLMQLHSGADHCGNVIKRGII